MSTILSSIYDFFIAHDGDMASKILASAGYDVLKNSINFKSLKDEIKKFFKKDEDVEKFISSLATSPLDTKMKPEDAIKAEYEKLVGQPFEDEILESVKTWLTDNKEQIKTINVVSISNSSGFNIGTQTAGRDVVNIAGNYTITPKVDGD